MECGGRRFESSHPDQCCRLAQLAERRSLKAKVRGSRPRAATNHVANLSREARAVMGRSAKPEETGSTPVRASNWLQWLEWTGARFLLGSMRVRILLGAPHVNNGRERPVVACVAQRMSARVLSGMTLVRFQSQAPLWRVKPPGGGRRLLSDRCGNACESCSQLSAMRV